MEVGAVVAVDLHASWWARTSSQSRVAAKHSDAGAILGASEGNHVLADVARNKLAMVRIAMGQDVLDQVVTKLISGNCKVC